MELTHTNKNGQVHMVDVGEKEVTRREAKAHGLVRMKPETLRLIKENLVKKGDVFSAARIAGIMAAKRTGELIPLCHTVPLSSVEIDFNFAEPDAVEIIAAARCDFKTGVEMEALTAVSAAALTIYDMCKAVDRGMEIGEIYLMMKSGGRLGLYVRPEEKKND